METEKDYKPFVKNLLELERMFYNKRNNPENLTKIEKEKIARTIIELTEKGIIDKSREAKTISLLFNSDHYFIIAEKGLRKIIQQQENLGLLNKIEAKKDLKDNIQSMKKEMSYYNGLSQEDKQKLVFMQLYKALAMYSYFSNFADKVSDNLPYHNIMGKGLEGIVIDNINELTKDEDIKIQKHKIKSKNEVGKLESFSSLKELLIIKKVPKSKEFKLEEEFSKAHTVYSAMSDISSVPKPIMIITDKKDYDYGVFYKLPSCTAAEFMKSLGKKLGKMKIRTNYLTKKDIHEVKYLIRKKYAEEISRAVAEVIAKMQVKVGRFVDQKQEKLSHFDFEFYYKDKIRPNLLEFMLTKEQEEEMFKSLKGKSQFVIHRDMHPNNVLFEEHLLPEWSPDKKYWLTSASIIDFELMSEASSAIFDIVTFIESNYRFKLSEEQKIRILKYFAKKVREYGGELSDEEVEENYKQNAIFANLRLAAVNSVSLKNSENTDSKSYGHEKFSALKRVKELLTGSESYKKSEIESLFEESEKIYVNACEHTNKTIADKRNKYTIETIRDLNQEFINKQLNGYSEKDKDKIKEIIGVIGDIFFKGGYPYNNGLHEEILSSSQAIW